MLKIAIPLPLKVAASILLLAFVLTKVDAPSLFVALSASDPYLLLLSILLSFAAWCINTLKWQILLRGAGARVGYMPLLQLTFIGQFYNLVLPGQVGGEVVKSVKLARLGVSGAISAVSVVTDRVTGLLAVVLLGLLGVSLTPSVLTNSPGLLFWVVVLGCLLVIASVVLVTGRGPAAARTMGRTVGLHRSDLLRKLSAQFERLHLPSNSLSALVAPFALAVIVQFLFVLINFIVCVALGISITIPQLLWIVAIVAVLQSLPISIAGLGVREGAYVYLLQLYGVPGSSALALSLLIFAMQVLMALTGGLLHLNNMLHQKELSRG